MAERPTRIVGDIVPPTNDPVDRRRLRRLPPTRPAMAPTLDLVSATWGWKDQANGTITWTFTNTSSNQVSFILLRNGYYFGNAYFPIYVPGMTHFASSLAPLNGSIAPVGVVGFPQADGSSKYIACFIFTLAGNSSWSMDEGGFSQGFLPSGISTHIVTERLHRDTCIFYDQTQVSDYDNQLNSTAAGFAPNPSVFNTVVMDAAADAPYIVLYPNDAITNELKFVAIAAAPQPYEWWWGLTGDEVNQKVQASKMQLHTVAAYVDLDRTVRFAITLAPPTGQSWWYWGLSGADVQAKLAENNAALTDISPYVAPDGSLRFAVIMAPPIGEWWWYWGQSSENIAALLQQNNAMLTKISPYWDPDGSFRFAVILAPNDGHTLWYWGLRGEDVQAKLTESRAQLVDISPYIDGDNTVKFGVIMRTPVEQEWMWWWGYDADGMTQQLSANNQRLTVVKPFFDCG